MLKKKFKLYIVLLVIGFIFISLDLNISTGLKYPYEYDNSNNVTGEFQYYNIASNYGASCTYKWISSDIKDDSSANTSQSNSAQSSKVIDKIYFDNIRIDIFNDIVGFILIFVSCVGLRMANRKFRFAALSAFSGSLLCAAKMCLPFVFNGLQLCNLALVIGLVYLICNVTTTFLFSYGLLSMCRDICCRDERKWCKICWFVSCVTQCLTTFVFWLGSDFPALTRLGWILQALLTFIVILFWMILRRTMDYIYSSYVNAIEKR